MKRYINVADLYGILNKMDMLETYNDFISVQHAINNTPTADVVEVKYGEWIPYPSNAYMKCSVCGMEYAKEKMPNIVGYCPNPYCGAKMDERRDIQ